MQLLVVWRLMNIKREERANERVRRRRREREKTYKKRQTCKGHSRDNFVAVSAHRIGLTLTDIKFRLESCETSRLTRGIRIRSGMRNYNENSSRKFRIQATSRLNEVKCYIHFKREVQRPRINSRKRVRAHTFASPKISGWIALVARASVAIDRRVNIKYWYGSRSRIYDKCSSEFIQGDRSWGEGRERREGNAA